MITAALTGFGTAFSLILAIGAQNAFVLRQGLMRKHVFWVCLICALSDAVLISIGVAGTGGVAAAHPQAITVLTLGGAGFLTIYGGISLARAFDPQTLRAAETGAEALRTALLTCLALTWLNPHVYVDTIGIIGVVATSLDSWGERIVYGIGATMASFVFFFSLGYGARLLAPVFARERAWVVLDIVIALVMWSIAASLLLGLNGFLGLNGQG